MTAEEPPGVCGIIPISSRETRTSFARGQRTAASAASVAAKAAAFHRHGAVADITIPVLAPTSSGSNSDAFVATIAVFVTVSVAISGTTCALQATVLSEDELRRARRGKATESAKRGGANEKGSRWNAEGKGREGAKATVVNA